MNHGSILIASGIWLALQGHGRTPRLGSLGDGYDNAMVERLEASLARELIDRRVRQTKTQARLDIFTWIEA